MLPVIYSAVILGLLPLLSVNGAHSPWTPYSWTNHGMPQHPYTWHGSGPIWYMPRLICSPRAVIRPWQYICCGDRLYNRQNYDSCCCDRPYSTCSHICCGRHVHKRYGGQKCCGDHVINPLYQLCCKNNAVHTKESRRDKCCGSVRYNPSYELCCNGKIHHKDSRDHVCCGSKVISSVKQACCGKKPYSTGAHVGCCHNKKTGDYVVHDDRNTKCCNGVAVNFSKKSVSNPKQYKCCRPKPVVYNTAKQVCCHGYVKSKPPKGRYSCCGPHPLIQYNHLCCADNNDVFNIHKVSAFTHGCCGVNAYVHSTHICCNGVIQQRSHGIDTGCCGNAVFHKKKQICCGQSKIYKRYSVYDGCCEFGTTVGLMPFNKKTQVCCCKGVKERPKGDGLFLCCDDTVFNARRQMCCGGKIYHKGIVPQGCCGGDTVFTRLTHVCCGGQLHKRKHGYDRCCCSIHPYNSKKQRCERDSCTVWEDKKKKK